MFGLVFKKRLVEAEKQIACYQEMGRIQAELIATLRTWQASHVAQLERQAALRAASVTVTMALGRHPGDDLSDNPLLASAVLLLQCSGRSTQADAALLALAQALRDPMADMVDACFE